MGQFESRETIEQSSIEPETDSGKGGELPVGPSTPHTVRVAAQALDRLPEIERSTLPSADPMAFYLNAATRVTALAREYLEAGLGGSALETLRSDALTQVQGDASTVSKAQVVTGTMSEIQERYERLISEELTRIGQLSADEAATDAETVYRAAGLALGAIRTIERDESIERHLAAGGLQRLEEYQSIMTLARERVGPENSAEIASAFAEIVQQRHGYYPELRVISDFDGNLTMVPESGSPWKPGERTNAGLPMVEAAAGIPLWYRLVLTESPGCEPERQALAEVLFHQAAEHSTLFCDVPYLCQLLDRERLVHGILTANHASLVAAKCEDLGLPVGSIVGMEEERWYDSKVSVLLESIVAEPRYCIWYMGDDNDRGLADHIGGTDPLSLRDVVFWGTRAHDDIREYRVKDALEKTGLPHITNTYEANGNGVQGTISFVEEYLAARAAASGLANRWPYAPSEGLRHYRSLSTEMPQPSIRTVIRPSHESSQVGEDTVAYQQYDLGVPTAVALHADAVLLMYKAATGPSQSAGAAHSSPSYVFAAVYQPSTGAVTFLNGDGETVSQPRATPFFQSSLPPHLSQDGVHDPRATRVMIGEQELTLILACAFNKEAEQQSIKEAGGDISRPIRGAVTEVLGLKDPRDPTSIVIQGQFGPDYHSKNMVFFPETFNRDGEEYVAFLTRKMPSIQVAMVSVADLHRLPNDAPFRNTFWDEVFSRDSARATTVLTPEISFEGKGSPHADHGQVAPGVPPIKVSIEGQSYWLMVYNAVPDSKAGQGGNALGRVIGAALLSYEDPTVLVSRCPHPIVLPSTNEQFIAEEGVPPRHADVAFTGGGLVTEDGHLLVFYTEGDSLIRVAAWSSVEQLASYVKTFDAAGFSLEK